MAVLPTQEQPASLRIDAPFPYTLVHFAQLCARTSYGICCFSTEAPFLSNIGIVANKHNTGFPITHHIMFIFYRL